MESQASINTNVRKIGAIRAFFGNFLGGLGYLYVGRPKLALVLLFWPYLISALIGWTKLVFFPPAFFTFAVIYLLLIFFFPIHSAVIALRNKRIEAKPYNCAAGYVLWSIAFVVLSFIYLWFRAQMFGYEPFRVPSMSNMPTINSGDYFIANTWRYKFHEPEIGEFVVYDVNNKTKYIKRLVGLPGDTIELRDGVLYRNGNAVNEPYLHERVESMPYGRDKTRTTLAPDEFYVLGDFRDNSNDSRFMGAVRRVQLHGRAEFIWFSYSDGSIRWDRFGKSLVPVPNYTTSK